jgi:hypothetical protein
MMKKTIAALILTCLSVSTTWAVGTDNSYCIGQGHGCLPPAACGTIGYCLCTQIFGGTTATWSTHDCQTTTTTTANSVTMSMHCSDTSQSISTGPMIWMCSRMFVVGCMGQCHVPVVPPLSHVSCATGCN